MTRPELLAFLPDVPWCPVHLGASEYRVPTLGWLRGPFYEAFTRRYWNEGLGKWSRRYECRDFARAYAAMAVECWATSNEIAEEDSIAVGELWFNPTPSTGHAICPAITDVGLVFIDPQNNQLCTLSTEQLLSRYFLRW